MHRDSSKKQQNITIYDVAARAGFSVSTVSRVFNGFEFVRESTRERIMEAAAELGYVANLQARSLAGGRSRYVGLLVPGLDNGYVGGISQGVDRALASAGYGLMLFTTHHHRGQELGYIDTIANGLTAGLLITVPLVPKSYVEALQQQQFPVVLIDQADTSIKSSVVDTTNWQGGYTATEHLIHLGHRRIGFITGLMALRSATDRLAGYKMALKDHDIAVDESLIVEGDYMREMGYAATRQLLTTEQRPTAIVAANDFTALGAMEAIHDEGLGIPNDISIIGFDDIPEARVVHPKLTTVRLPLEQMGRVAVELLLEHIEDPEQQPKHITLSTQLIERQSCAAPKALPNVT